MDMVFKDIEYMNGGVLKISAQKYRKSPPPGKNPRVYQRWDQVPSRYKFLFVLFFVF
jgi:hypothetical protein